MWKIFFSIPEFIFLFEFFILFFKKLLNWIDVVFRNIQATNFSQLFINNFIPILRISLGIKVEIFIHLIF